MLTGKEKALLVVSLLQDQAKDILPLLSSDSAKIMTESIEDAPKIEESQFEDFLNEILEKTQEMKQSENDDSSQEEELNEEDDVSDDSMDEDHSDVLDEEDKDEEEDDSQDGEDDSDELDGSEQNRQEEDNTKNKGLRVLSELRSHEKVAEKLSVQKPQIIAFILSRLSDDHREMIESHMDEVFLKKIGKLKVESLPLEDKIFNNLYNVVFKKSEEELELERQEQLDNIESSGSQNEFVEESSMDSSDYGVDNHVDEIEEVEPELEEENVNEDENDIDSELSIDDVETDSLDESSLDEKQGDLEEEASLEEEMASFS